MRIIFISFLILIADQLSKMYVKGVYLPMFNLEHSGLPESKSISIIDNFFYITPVENPGIAFGIDFGPEFKTVISIVTIIATIGLLIYFVKIRNEDLLTRLSVVAILGGAMGNLVDRIFYGYFYGYAPILSGNVVDFIDLRLFSFFMMNKSYNIYVFNIADMAISLGVCALIFAITRKRRELRRSSVPQVENNLSVD